MNEIYLGEIVNTHGIKGELRIISNFKYKKEDGERDRRKQTTGLSSVYIYLQYYR